MEVVQQYHRGGRYSQLATGIHVLTRDGVPINLGAHGNPNKVREIGRAIADFYGLSFADRARDEVFRAFRRRKTIIFLVGLAIAAAIIIIERLLRGG